MIFKCSGMALQAHSRLRHWVQVSWPDMIYQGTEKFTRAWARMGPGVATPLHGVQIFILAEGLKIEFLALSARESSLILFVNLVYTYLSVRPHNSEICDSKLSYLNYKVIEILAVRWLAMKLQATKVSRTVSWERRWSQYNLFSASIEYCTGVLVRSENEARILYTVENYFAV